MTSPISCAQAGIEKKLKVVATTRNFNTMSKLIALSTGTDGVSPANIQ
ncbi:hypothetical protein [Alcaligenes aquatilis]|nr:hypothetical protein [Alcaligenes aquatilis]